MVYCSKCGTENSDEAEVCSNCGASLKTPTFTRARRRRRDDDICFGSTGGMNWFGLFIGIMIILVGITSLLGDTYWWATWDRLWPIPVILFGLVIIYNTLYKNK
jgi:uncharacterized membrane protein YvbJ